MTLDELIKKARELKKNGMPGDTEVLVQTDWVKVEDGDHRTTHYLEPVTVRLGEPTGPRNQIGHRRGIVVDGRGRPKDTERAVRLI